MKKIILLIFLISLTGCVSTIEPTSQKNNPAKASDEIMIIYSDPEEIYIMANEVLLGKYKSRERPNEKMLATALNHCEMYKKDAHHIWRPASPIPYKFRPGDYMITYGASKADLYDWSTFRYQNKIYQGYRFICANSKNKAINTKVDYKVSWFGYAPKSWWAMHRGSLDTIENKRFISEQEIAENKRKELEEKARIAKLEKQRRVALIESLENEYGNVCLKNENNNKFLKGTIDYENCLIAHDEKIIAQKRETDELRKQKQRELEEKLAKMSPTERHAYNCTETFNFKKGSEKFNDCVFELYTAELDIQKLELEKQVAEANAKAASNEQLRAEALAKAQIAAANASTRAANLNSSMQLMKLSEQLIRGNQQQNPFNQNNARLRTTCSNVGGFLTCF